MQANKFYQNKRMKWFRIYINYITENKPDFFKANVSWWRQNEKTGRFEEMGICDELMVHKKDNDWEELADSIERRIDRHWRPG